MKTTTKTTKNNCNTDVCAHVHIYNIKWSKKNKYTKAASEQFTMTFNNFTRDDLLRQIYLANSTRCIDADVISFEYETLTTEEWVKKCATYFSKFAKIEENSEENSTKTLYAHVSNIKWRNLDDDDYDDTFKEDVIYFDIDEQDVNDHEKIWAKIASFLNDESSSSIVRTFDYELISEEQYKKLLDDGVFKKN